MRKLLISAGAMKAGTSYLFKMIERHPGVEVTPVKEIHYFAHLHTTLTLLDEPARLHALKTYAAYLDAHGEIESVRKGLRFFSRYLRRTIDDEWYESLFESGEDIFKADFSNLASVLCDDGLRHIRRMAEDVRVVYLLRDPLARLWSHVKFHAAVNNELDCLSAFDQAAFTRYFEASGAAAQSRYADNICRIRRHFPSEKIKIIYFEDMICEPRRELACLFAFLGLPEIAFDDDELAVVHNPGPEAGIPANFIGAAFDFLAPLQDEMTDAGIGVHPHWRWL